MNSRSSFSRIGVTTIANMQRPCEAECEAKLWELTLTFSVTEMLGLILHGNIVLRLKVADFGRGAPLTLSLSLIHNVNISCLSAAN